MQETSKSRSPPFVVCIALPSNEVYKDYVDIILDKTYNETFHQRLEPIHFNAYLTLFQTIKIQKWRKLCYSY